MEGICETGPTVYSLYPRRLFNPRRLLPETKTYDPTACDFLFADDCAMNASSHQDKQVSRDLFASACTDFGLAISTKKTEVLHQPSPRAPHTEPNITAKGESLTVPDKFTYLGSPMTSSANINTEETHRIARASTAFGRLDDQSNGPTFLALRMQGMNS